MQQITDQILINHIFITIPDTSIIDTLQHLPEEQATVDYVVERLKDFEQLALKNDIGDPNIAGTSGSAMHAKGKGRKRGQGGRMGRISMGRVRTRKERAAARKRENIAPTARMQTPPANAEQSQACAQQQRHLLPLRRIRTYKMGLPTEEKS